jgi:hypothetical protein
MMILVFAIVILALAGCLFDRQSRRAYRDASRLASEWEARNAKGR